MSESNKAIVLRLMEECLNQHNLGVHPQIYSEGFVHHSPALGELRGEEHIQFLASMFAAFPDSRWNVLDQMAEGDKVVTRWTLNATHNGTFMGIAPTGNQVKSGGICIARIVDGKIVEEWEEWDTLGMMQQLGVVAVETSAGDMVAP